MKSVLLVRTDESDQPELGPEYRVHYELFQYEENEIENPHGKKYAVVVGDDQGNGVVIAEGNDRFKLQHMLLALGEFVRWEQP